ncbi:MAG: alpha/beta hydrolase, partial [Betaproteobacteria bacterium]
MSAESNAATESLEEWRRTGSLWQHAIGPVFTKVAGAHNVSAVLFIHGFPTASWDWAKVWAPLTAEFHCLALDMPGFGFSAKPRRFPYSIRAQADVLESFLAEQGVSEYAIVAHDYGDTVAQELMARHNEGTARQRLRKVALLNGGLFPETHQPVLLQKLLASPLGPLIARLTTYRKFSANMRRICALPLAEEELEGMWELMNLNGGMQVMPSLIGYMA